MTETVDPDLVAKANALCDNPRNIPDDVLAALPANGGVATVTFVPMFVLQAASDWMKGAAELLIANGLDRLSKTPTWGNAVRVLGDAQDVARELSRIEPPSISTIEELDGKS